MALYPYHPRYGLRDIEGCVSFKICGWRPRSGAVEALEMRSLRCYEPACDATLKLLGTQCLQLVVCSGVLAVGSKIQPAGLQRLTERQQRS